MVGFLLAFHTQRPTLMPKFRHQVVIVVEPSKGVKWFFLSLILELIWLIDLEEARFFIDCTLMLNLLTCRKKDGGIPKENLVRQSELYGLYALS